ncbi:hypothetical protein CIK87_13460 [Prevotella sp. P5-64]|nr:hypothetical protein CIK87_13460 [Prevotella sp. P5-64]
MLALLAIICTGGVKAAVGDTYKLVTSVDELKAGDVIVIGCKQYAKAMGAQNTNNRAAVGISITNGVFSFVDGIEELTLKKVNEKWQLVTSDGKYLYQPAKNTLQSTDDASNTNTQASISFTSAGNSTICFGKFTSFIKLNINPYCFSCYASSTSKTYIVQIYKKQDSGKTATTIAFAEGIENATVTVKNGETFEGYKATCTTEGATGAIQYSSSNTDVATVDESTGAVTMGSKYGKTVITAQFIGTGGYANSNKISYTIEYKGDYAFYESFDKCDGNGGWSGNAAAGLWDKNKLDNAWTKTGTVLLGAGCIRVGKEAASVTTPSIAISGSAVLTFKAGLWNTQKESTPVIVTISDGTLTYGNNTAKTISLNPGKGQWEKFEIVISGTKSFTLTFKNNDNKDNNRFFLDEVMVKEIAAADVTLDEAKDNVVEAAENANVTLKRTLYADGGWNTLCLPFSLTDEQTKAAFGDDVELRTLESVSGNTLTFAQATGITAGVPCLIKVGNVAEDNTYTFTGVTTIAVKDETDFGFSEKGDVEFVGIYSPADVSKRATAGKENALFLGAANKFYKAKAETRMNAFRAFFLVPASTDTQALRAVIDGTTTGIDDLNIDTVKVDGRVYNLNGQCVGYSLEGLKAGIYIQNGKKVIKK